MRASFLAISQNVYQQPVEGTSTCSWLPMGSACFSPMTMLVTAMWHKLNTFMTYLIVFLIMLYPIILSTCNLHVIQPLSTCMFLLGGKTIT